MSRLSDMGEDALIERLVRLVPTGELAEGPGDDCAVVDEGGDILKLLKTDALVEGVHYTADANARTVGWKAVARVVSDFAAMGGLPERFLVTVALRKSMEVTWIEDFYRGMGDCFSRYDAVLAGGETSSVPEGSAVVISIAATGRVEREKLVLRSGGEAGDELWVTGRLGGSLAGKHLSFLPRVDEARWLGYHTELSAMMDLSDGLASDLPRLAKASGCGFRLDRESIPVSEGCDLKQALCDGEDFELLFAVKPGGVDRAKWAERFPELGLTKIGELVAPGEGDVLDGGWDHFSQG
ncbi:MAG: thiamine-phosphate kinase [Luteolibacter sp.]